MRRRKTSACLVQFCRAPSTGATNHFRRTCGTSTESHRRRFASGRRESDWSPEQIAGWLKRAYPEDEHYQVSHETIYRSLYVQARGILKKELILHLRSKRTMRRPRRAGDKRG